MGKDWLFSIWISPITYSKSENSKQSSTAISKFDACWIWHEGHIQPNWTTILELGSRKVIFWCNPFWTCTISFSSLNTQFYDSRIFCLLTFWVFFSDKSLKFISKYTQKCKYNSLHKKEKKNTLQHLKLGIRKIGCLMSWARYCNRKF